MIAFMLGKFSEMVRFRLNLNHSLFLLVIPILIHCGSVEGNHVENNTNREESEIIIGNRQTEKYLPFLKGKKVGVVSNHTAMINDTHLVDSLIGLKVNILAVFSPEHGFRGTADAGEKVKNQIDPKTTLPIISLYGDNKKPSNQQLEGIEVLIFDIQDVGARFYTYISTLHYVMEAAAENNIPLVILDRPNPNGHYIDGPILDKKFKSFVGMHPIPIVHGLTIGEYAQMINGEKYLENEVQCELEIIKCKNYKHSMQYTLDIPPSPNLPNMNSIYLYPSLCLFEGTSVSVGRGTPLPFQQFGHPLFPKADYYFIPKPVVGASEPKLKGQKCYGQKIEIDSLVIPKELNLNYLLASYKVYPEKSKFFNNFFNLLAGNSELKKQIIAGKSESEIRDSWQVGLKHYKQKRKEYLLYEDFE